MNRLFLKKWANPGLFLIYFRLFLHDTIQIQIDKNIDSLFGIQTRGGSLEGVDESTQLWRHPWTKEGQWSIFYFLCRLDFLDDIEPSKVGPASWVLHKVAIWLHVKTPYTAYYLTTNYVANLIKTVWL